MNVLISSANLVAASHNQFLLTVVYGGRSNRVMGVNLVLGRVLESLQSRLGGSCNRILGGHSVFSRGSEIAPRRSSIAFWGSCNLVMGEIKPRHEASQITSWRGR